MLYDGRPIHAAEAFPLLLLLADQAGAHRLEQGCSEHPAFHAPDPDGHPELARWSVCPLDLCLSPHYQAVFELAAVADLAPLAGWPDRYPYWMVRGLQALRARQAELLRKRQRQPPHG